MNFDSALTAAALAMVIGWALKNWKVAPTKLIPIINFVLQFLGQLVLVIKPAEAGIFSGAFAHTLGQIAMQAGLATILATGTHSTFKNAWQQFRDVALAAAQQKAADKLQQAK